MFRTLVPAALLGAAVVAAPATAAIDVTITIENLSPDAGTNLTPFWVGFHDGGFDLFNQGEAASAGLERLAEDGSISPLSDMFNASGFGGGDGIVAPGGPFAPGAIASTTFSLDESAASSRFFSYAAMVLPSNDAFVGNGDATGIEIFDANGNFTGGDFFITGANVYDAGTEVNDELPENTAFFGQAAPDTGVTEGGTVGLHPGFLGSAGNPGTPSILADPNFAGADFTLAGYPIARITITAVPAPGALALLGLAGFAGRRRRRG
ncbi:MAG: spondin domain-containing protein [Phycisphaerales bacterium]